MLLDRIGPIRIIQGDHHSRVPYSTSLLIEGQKDATLIDCGCGMDALQTIKKDYFVSSVYLTHYHLDHVWGAYLFDDVPKYINRYDLNKLNDPSEFAKVHGYNVLHSDHEVEKWLHTHFVEGQTFQQNRPHYKPIMGTVQHTFPYETSIDVSGVHMQMLHLPGHTQGYCCPYFPDQGLLFVGDFDLTSFGPWYNNCDSDIEAFQASARKTLEVDADYFVTSHHKGGFNRKEYMAQLTQYLSIIDRREAQTQRAMDQGIPPKELVRQEIFYFLTNHEQNPQLMESEIIGIAKHIKLLIKKGGPYENYYKAFCETFHLDDSKLEYRSEPVDVF